MENYIGIMFLGLAMFFGWIIIWTSFTIWLGEMYNFFAYPLVLFGDIVIPLLAFGLYLIN